MNVFNRRLFLKFAAAACTPYLTEHWPHGKNFEGSEITLGDALYTAPGEPPVTSADIETIHSPDYSELHANVLARRIMAHNITFYRVIDPALLYIFHVGEFQFRLPETAITGQTGETLEGGLFVWDGGGTRLDYGTAFQWIVNPSSPSFQDIQVWSSGWQRVGTLPLDSDWHKVRFSFHRRARYAVIMIDRRSYRVRLVGTPRPSDWGTETAARLQVEIISRYPGETGDGALHTGQFRNWRWNVKRHVIRIGATRQDRFPRDRI